MVKCSPVMVTEEIFAIPLDAAAIRISRLPGVTLLARVIVQGWPQSPVPEFLD
jgi:hypothetical protein